MGDEGSGKRLLDLLIELGVCRGVICKKLLETAKYQLLYELIPEEQQQAFTTLQNMNFSVEELMTNMKLLVVNSVHPDTTVWLMR